MRVQFIDADTYASIGHPVTIQYPIRIGDLVSIGIGQGRKTTYYGRIVGEPLRRSDQAQVYDVALRRETR